MAAQRVESADALAEQQRVRELPIKRINQELRIENVHFCGHSYAEQSLGFIQRMVKCVSTLTARLVPGFVVPIQAPMDDAQITWHESFNETMGYHDYSIFHQVANLAGANGYGLQVRLSRSNGYDPAESCLVVKTTGLPEGRYVYTLAELESGKGLLAWHGLNLMEVFGDVFAVAQDGSVRLC